MAMTALQKTLVTATVVALAGVGIYQGHQAAQLRDQVQTLQQQNEQLRSEGESLSNRLGRMGETKAPLAQSLAEKQFAELLRLRGEVGLLRQQLAVAESTPKPATNHIVFPGLYLPREAWSDYGTDEPRNTILTMFWALRQGDQSKLQQLVSPGPGARTLDQLFFPRDDWERISAIQVAGVTVTRSPTSPPVGAVEVIVEIAPPVGQTDRDVRMHRWFLTRVNDQWLFANWNY
jgi:hypothetical protein